jgi:hypothetical protein
MKRASNKTRQILNEFAFTYLRFSDYAIEPASIPLNHGKAPARLCIPFVVPSICSVAPVQATASLGNMHGIREYTPVATGPSTAVIQQTIFSHRVTMPLLNLALRASV